MKRKIYYGLLCASLLLVACEKYETYPVERISADIVYDEFDKNGTYADWVVNDIYSYLPNGFNRIGNVMLDAATDDAISTQRNPTIDALAKGQLNANYNPDDNWDNAYMVIRKVNMFLSKIDIVPRDEATKNYWKAEVRFLRALHYFELLKRYGGVPLLGDNYYALTDKIEVERSSYEDVVQYIIQEMDAIKDMLRPDPIGDTFLGRVTHGAALALKARVLLYAASPLNNPENAIQKWQAAALAAKELVTAGKFSLVANYADVFLTRKNTETILAKQLGQNFALEQLNAPIGFDLPNFSNGYISPSQNFVDAFPMANGKKITLPNAGYDAQNPYLKRDPRLKASVFFNGSKWLNRTVELYMGGKDRPNVGLLQTRQTKTGYYLRKFLGNFETASNYSNVSHNFILFRYAEVLLNYAEASNELNDQATAYIQLKALRKRAGIEAGADNLYGLEANMSQETMREAIRLERRLELSFEEHRYWDLRRWKLAETVLNQSIKGVEIVRKADATFDYSVQDVGSVSFQKHHYLYPIPLKEIVANQGRLKQNPGW